MTKRVVGYETHGGVVRVTLDRPQALNAVSRELARELVTALRAADAAADVRAVVLTGAGERAFCAGVDLREASVLAVADVEPWFRVVAECYRQILLVDKPVVVALNGVGAGAGYQMALVADWRLGHPGTRLTQPEINAGLPSIMGAYWMSFHLPWSLNQELSYSGRLLSAEEARAAGLLNEVVAAGELQAAAHARAEALAAKSPIAFRHTKARFREMALAGFEDALRAAVLGMQAAYAAGEPQAAMTRFLALRDAAASGPGEEGRP